MLQSAMDPVEVVVVVHIVVVVVVLLSHIL